MACRYGKTAPGGKVNTAREEKLLDVSMVAKRLDVSPATAYRLIGAGVLNAIRTGLTKGFKVKQGEVDAYLLKRDNSLI
jgi:excisionase family DNA binding protein